MPTYSSILAWRIPWIEEPVRLQSMGSQRVRHNFVCIWSSTPTPGHVSGENHSSKTYAPQCSSVQFSRSVVSDSFNPMNHSTPGLPVHHKLLEFTQTHAHRVGDAIQPSHPLSSPSSPAPNPSQHQGLFQWVNSSHEVVKVLEFQLQHQSFQWTPRTDLLQDGLVGSPCSPRDSK